MRLTICHWCLRIIFKLLPRESAPVRYPRGDRRNALRQIWINREFMDLRGSELGPFLRSAQETTAGMSSRRRPQDKVEAADPE